jgi:hypothetical protein
MLRMGMAHERRAARFAVVGLFEQCLQASCGTIEEEAFNPARHQFER